MFACEHDGVVPDLITTAKGIAGGLPLAAVTGRAEIMDATHVGGLGGTYGGQPGRLRGGARGPGRVRARRPDRAGARIEATRHRAAAGGPGRPTHGSVTSAVGAPCSPSSWSTRPAADPDAAAGRRGGQGGPRRGRDRPDLRHLRQRHPAAAAADDQRRAARRGSRRAAQCPGPELRSGKLHETVGSCRKLARIGNLATVLVRRK